MPTPTTPEVSAALEEWAKRIRPDLTTFAARPEDLGPALPTVICEIESEADGAPPADLRDAFGYEGLDVRRWEATLEIAVRPFGAGPDRSERPAAQESQEIVSALRDAARRDRRLEPGLGLRASKTVSIEYPGIARYADGPLVRLALVRLVVAAAID